MLLCDNRWTQWKSGKACLLGVRQYFQRGQSAKAYSTAVIVTHRVTDTRMPFSKLILAGKVYTVIFRFLKSKRSCVELYGRFKQTSLRPTGLHSKIRACSPLSICRYVWRKKNIKVHTDSHVLIDRVVQMLGWKRDCTLSRSCTHLPAAA